MVRKIFQVTEEQSRQLRERAKKEHISESELIRRALDSVLDAPTVDEEAKRRAIEAVGFADFGIKDLAERHDEYYAEALNEHLR